MFQNQRLVEIDLCLVVQLFAMLYNIGDHGLRIRSSEYQTHFADHTVNDIPAILLKLVRINRKGGNIPMLYKLLRILAGFGAIEFAIGIDTLIAILKEGVAEYRIGIIMAMIPNKRHFLAVILLESVLHNRSTVSTANVISGCPTSKIIRFIHFDFPPWVR